MTPSPWSWQRADTGREPIHEGDAEEYKDHRLRAIEGIFGEQLVWQCRACGLERQSTKDIDTKCPNSQPSSSASSSSSSGS